MSGIALACATCGRRGSAKDGASADFAWCRDCGRTLCRPCNGAHSEHRSAAWQDWDVLKSAALAFEARTARRSRLAEREQRAIKEFVGEVETRLSTRVARDLERRNESDRRRVKALAAAMGDAEGRSLLASPLGGPPSLDRTLTDADLERLTREVLKIQPDLTESLLQDPIYDSPIVDPKAAFSVLPPNLSPRAFLNILEEQLRRELRINQGTGGDEADSSFGGSRGQLNISTSTPLDDEEDLGPRREFRFPLEPKVNISNGAASLEATQTFTSSAPNGRPGSSRDSVRNLSGLLETSLNGSRGAASTSAQDEADGRTRAPRPGFFQPAERVGSDPRLSRSLRGAPESRHDESVDNRLRLSRSSLDPSASRSSTPRLGWAVDSFHFGEEFLKRPIDVAVLPGERLAISDSDGGVFVTTRGGEFLHHIPTNASASSLAYSRSDSRIYVSLLLPDAKASRLIRAYDTQTFELLDELKAPTQPSIENKRARWVAASNKGDLFMASGDGKRSALWKLSPLSSSWITVREWKNTRFQYLQVVEENAETNCDVVMTVDGMTGSVQLFVVGHNGQLHSEYDLVKTKNLSAYVRSPASAVVDADGNLLVVDYLDGKLWIHYKGSGAQMRAEAERVRFLAELGPRAALGLSVSRGWAYVACLHRRRVHALHYGDDDGPPTPLPESTA